MSRLHPIPFPYGTGILLEPDAPRAPAHDERIVIPTRRRRKGNDNA
jgi:hypothetical protein